MEVKIKHGLSPKRLLHPYSFRQLFLLILNPADRNRKHTTRSAYYEILAALHTPLNLFYHSKSFYSFSSWLSFYETLCGWLSVTFFFKPLSVGLKTRMLRHDFFNTLFYNTMRWYLQKYHLHKCNKRKDSLSIPSTAVTVVVSVSRSEARPKTMICNQNTVQHVWRAVNRCSHEVINIFHSLWEQILSPHALWTQLMALWKANKPV